MRGDETLWYTVGEAARGNGEGNPSGTFGNVWEGLGYTSEVMGNQEWHGGTARVIHWERLGYTDGKVGEGLGSG
jgi:hypothetical protein